MRRTLSLPRRIALFSCKWLLCIMGFIPAALAQTSYHISTGNGLSTNNMTAVIRGKDNYMWTGSYNGLHKHEGSVIRVFNKTGRDNASISSAEIHTVFEDREGFVWLGTTGGLDRLDPTTNRIKHFTLRAGNQRSSYLGYIYSVFQDAQDKIWISTDVALFRMNANTGEYKQIPVKKDGSGVPSGIISYKGGISTGKGVWMQTNEGITYYEYDGEQFYHRYHNPKNWPVFNTGRRQGQSPSSELCMDKDDNIYFINSDAKLIRYNPATTRLDSFAFRHPGNAWKCCYSIASDRRGNIWMGFRHGGLLFFNATSKQFTPVLYKGANSLIQSNYVYSLAEDYLGAIWVSTNNGIDVIDWYDRSVRQTYLSEDARFINLDYPSGMMSYDGDQYLYIPFFRGGLFRYDTHTDSLQHFKIKDTAQQHVSYVDIGRDGITWLGNTRSLVPATLQDSTIRYYRQKNSMAEHLQTTNSSITWIVKDHSNAYIKKVNGNIYRFNGSDSLEKIAGYGFMKQMTLSRDSQFLLFINRELNIVKHHLRTGKTDTIPVMEKLEPTGFLYFNPRDLADDGKGNIWIASQNGVLRYDSRSDSLYVYTTSHGLANNFTYSLCADKKKRVWVASLGGIDWFDEDRNVFKNVAMYPSSTYMDSYGSAAETKDGTIFFLAGNTLFLVNPDQYFLRPSYPYQLSLNELQVNGETISFNATERLQHLRPNQNRLAFRFGLLNFTPHNDVAYHYYLEGIEKDWVENKDRSIVTYSALSPGRYILHIKATDASGNLISKEQSISFRIHASFWQTIWFRILSALMIAGILYLLYNYRQRKQKEKELQKMLIAESRFLNLRLQMNPHFLFNSLNSIQHLIVTQQHAKAYQYLTLFSHLLRSVLQYAERDFISLDAELHMLKMYLDLEAMRFKDSFHYEITVDESLDQEEVMVPSLLVQPFAENAIWHGLLNKEGEKRLTITFQNSDECLICRVSDNGIGREKAAERKQQQMDIPFYESKGIRIVKERLGLLEQRTGKKSGIKVTDLYHGNGVLQPAGTLVEISIPFYYSEEV